MYGSPPTRRECPEADASLPLSDRIESADRCRLAETSWSSGPTSIAYSLVDATNVGSAGDRDSIDVSRFNQSYRPHVFVVSRTSDPDALPVRSCTLDAYESANDVRGGVGKRIDPISGLQ